MAATEGMIEGRDSQRGTGQHRCQTRTKSGHVVMQLAGGGNAGAKASTSAPRLLSAKVPGMHSIHLHRFLCADHLLLLSTAMLVTVTIAGKSASPWSLYRSWVLYNIVKGSLKFTLR